MFATTAEVVVGFDVGLRLGDTFEAAHGHGAGLEDDDTAVHRGFHYRVVGRLPRSATPWDRAIVAPVEAIWLVHARPSGHREGGARIGPPWDSEEVPGASAVVVTPASVADAYRLRARYREGETMAVFPGEVLVELYALLGDVRDALALVAGLTQALVVAAVLLAVLAAEAQRQRQHGVLRALGASRGYVLAAVWGRVVLLIAGGGALGLGMGWGLAWTVSAVFSARTGIALPVSLTHTELGLVVVVVASGSVLAPVPGWQIYRQRLATLLRG